MTCEHCEQLISAFVDGELEQVDLGEVKLHLEQCQRCSEIQKELKEILLLCSMEKIDEAIPPNEKALWCRISNLIEAETKTLAVEEQKVAEAPRSFWQNVWARSWSLSFSQLASAILAIALISSLLTLVGLRSNSEPSNLFATTAETPPTLFERALAKVGLIETPAEIRKRRIEERHAAIEYWNNRVQLRREQWDAKLREAFDRNVTEIDFVVNENTRILDENPYDELSGELLDSALLEKMELLREFAEL